MFQLRVKVSSFKTKPDGLVSLELPHEASARATMAIRNTINIFAKYNDLRNNKSAAHPNPLLQKAEAEYAVKVVADTLMFIDSIEKSKTKKTIPWGNGELFVDLDGELPF